ncbi:hydroxypyruvate isomerase [Acidisoma cladoniae]|jgi:hydroxypyruvate isomerase|uniref:hydroxypyruvate isomerase n=1 Tax=Acidisoma cladoniae TaxID=3040935 RepID=UPI0025510A0D|nr:hydroxypyruvate isomerase [Acidisoma sp. PAMC 29798]
MPKFAANLTMLFTELPFLARFQAAAAAGFDAVEFLFPYDFEKEVVADTARGAGVRVILHNLPCGDWNAGERGIACLPDRIEEFRSGVAKAIDYATALGCPTLNCLAGLTVEGVDPARQRAVLVDNLRFAAAALADADLRLVLEPVNDIDVPRFYLPTTRMALGIMDEVGATNLRLQYDLYHQQRMAGELATTLETQFARIGHIQLADNPGRHEPGTGEINYPYLFNRIDALGYTGWIGCEYKPATTTIAGLGWLAPYLGAT